MLTVQVVMPGSRRDFRIVRRKNIIECPCKMHVFDDRQPGANSKRQRVIGVIDGDIDKHHRVGGVDSLESRNEIVRQGRGRQYRGHTESAPALVAGQRHHLKPILILQRLPKDRIEINRGLFGGILAHPHRHQYNPANSSKCGVARQVLGLKKRANPGRIIDRRRHAAQEGGERGRDQQPKATTRNLRDITHGQPLLLLKNAFVSV